MLQDSFFYLVRLGIGQIANPAPDNIDWEHVYAIATRHQLLAVVVDGIEKLTDDLKPPKNLLLEWIGEVLQSESIYVSQRELAKRMASLFHNNGILTYVLKGTVVAECYPKPPHRSSVDMDCYLLSEQSDFDVWSFGNDLIKAQGFEVAFEYYKNSTFYLSGLTVENHHYFTPFRGNKRLLALEKKLHELIRQDKGEDIIKGTWLYRPPVMATALFLIEHAYSHFLHEGLTWRMVLDWTMFSQKHEKEIDKKQLEAWIDEFGFRKFYDSYNRLGLYLIGESHVSGLTFQDQRMLEDVWSGLDVHETVKGIKGKFNLVGNTWRARWKYHYFSEDSMLKALWIQVKGYLFEKNPTLNEYNN